jgi:hypothetical protein
MTDTDIYMQWAVAIGVGLFMVWRGQMTLFHPSAVYLAFHVIVFCIRPTMVHFFDFDFVFRYMQLQPKSADMQLALHLSSVGLVTLVGAFTVAASGAKPLRFGKKRELNEHDRRAFFVMAAIFGPAGIYSVVAARPKGEMIDGVFVMTGTSGYVNDLQNVLIPVCISLVLVFRWRWWSFLPFLVYIFYRMNQGWGRWTFILSCFLLVLVWLWDHRRRVPPWWSFLAAPLMAMLFLKLSHDRMFFRAWLAGEQSYNVQVAESSSDWRVKWDTLDFANYDFLVYIATHVPRNTKSHTYGAQYLQLFTEPIPRKLWKGKPIGAPVKFYELNDYGNFVGLTPSIIGDGWQSGGWLGMLLTVTFAGGILGVAYRWFTHNQEVVHKACAFLILNAMVVQLFRDGGISIFKFLFFALVPLFVWQFISSRFRMETEIGDEREALREARFARFAGAGAALGASTRDDEEGAEGEYEEDYAEEEDDSYDENDFEDEEDEEDEDDPPKHR